MFTKLIKLFVLDESGQSTLEYVGMLALGAILALYTYTNAKPLIEPQLLNIYNLATNSLNQIN